MPGSPSQRHGSPVDDGEQLYRAIFPDWWKATENRVSTAAFSFPYFSVDVVSIAGVPEAVLKRFSCGTGLILFECGDVKQVGCDVRFHTDELYPDNDPHAHVHMPPSNSERKRAAKALVKNYTLLVKPGVRSADST